jgi:hypothetical protein
MAIETWSPSQYSPFSGSYINKPEGEGWQITGYDERRIAMNPNRMGSGFKTVRVPIYTRMGQPAPTAGVAAAAPSATQAPLAAPELSPEAQAYRAEADAKLAEAQNILNAFKIEQNRAEEARKLQEQMQIRGQATLAANMAMSQRTPNLQISPASQTPETAGTQPFKRRRLQMMQPGQQVASGLNIGTSNFLNV